MTLRYISLNVGFILIAIIIFSTVHFTKTDTKINDDGLNNISLPIITPSHYNVKIEFDMYKNVFFGECNITIQINRKTETIIIMSSETFAVFQIDLIDNYNETINIPKFSFSNKTYIYLDFTQSSVNFLLPGTYVLKMIYVRSLLGDKDFFGSLYIHKEEDKVLNYEDIKIMRAGELFPCWDEPAFKSTFNITIGYHKKSYKLLSNMPIQKEVEDLNNMMWTYFDKSLLMSAQNLRIVITTFNNISTNITNVKIWCRKEIEKQMQFAVNISQGVVNYLKQKSTRSISKIDYFVLSDFPQSSIEMPGIILLREADVVYNVTLDDINRKVRVANLIAYQTISNWYNDISLWSKEGLLIFLTAYILKQSHLYNYMMDLFVVQTLQESFRFDTVHLRDSILSHTANTSTDYSAFRYNKVAIMWRLIHHLISDDVFWKSINLYTITKNYTNTDSLLDIVQIIFDSRGNPYKINIVNTINTWVMEKDCFELSAVRVRSHVVIQYVNSDSNATCRTLVTFMTKSKPYNFFPIDRKKKFQLPFILGNNDWIVINLQQIGYFRVSYSTNNWQNLAYYLYYENHTGIPVLNRAQIIDDAFYFVMQNRLNFTMFWNITHFLIKDINYVAWYPMIKAVEYMTCIFPMAQSSRVMNKIQEMFNGLLQNLRYDGGIHDSDFTKCLREEAVKWACVLDSPECKETATIKLQTDLYTIPPHITEHLRWKEWLYCKGLMIANHTIWLKVYSKWKETYDNTLLKYLSCSENFNTISNYVMTLMKNEITFNIEGHKRAYIILFLIARHTKNSNMLDFILQNIKDIEFSFQKHLDVTAMLSVIITHVHSVEHLEKIKKYVKNNLRERQLIELFNKKIKKRKSEYEKQVARYGRIGSYLP